MRLVLPTAASAAGPLMKPAPISPPAPAKEPLPSAPWKVLVCMCGRPGRSDVRLAYPLGDAKEAPDVAVSRVGRTMLRPKTDSRARLWAGKGLLLPPLALAPCPSGSRVGRMPPLRWPTGTERERRASERGERRRTPAPALESTALRRPHSCTHQSRPGDESLAAGVRSKLLPSPQKSASRYSREANTQPAGEAKDGWKARWGSTSGMYRG